MGARRACTSGSRTEFWRPSVRRSDKSFLGGPRPGGTAGRKRLKALLRKKKKVGFALFIDVRSPPPRCSTGPLDAHRDDAPSGLDELAVRGSAFMAFLFHGYGEQAPHP